ncbi:MAG: M43 family zinc metalloprotease, partial [Myxococcota bacterium]
LLATSEPPGDELDDVLSVNAFLVEDFNIPDMRGLLGVSGGIPGAAGLHGTNGSGLVFSTASLGTDNATLGQTFAHELGHFLGLRHTTEHLGRAHDPITDTPECLSPDFGYLCEDARNFMFAFSLGGGEQIQSTPGQAYVLRRNPLVKP